MQHQDFWWVMQTIPARRGELKSAASDRNIASEPVDVQHLRRYTLGDQKLEREIFQLFLTQLPELIAALRMAQTERDWRMAAHSLKGAGRAIGAWRIARLAEGAEGLAFVIGCEACKTAVAEFDESASEVRQYIETVWGAG
jgi:HPt (histidine-containing phosphotransfer) domain-containing protein